MGDSQHRDMVQPYQGLVTCFNLYSFFVIYIYIFFWMNHKQQRSL